QQLVSLATPIAHVITPEPEPALSVLGINPNVVKAGQSQVFITIIGTGFDVNNAQALVIQPTPALAVADKGILSDNLAFLKLNTSGLAGNSTFALKVTMTDRKNSTARLTTGFAGPPPQTPGGKHPASPRSRSRPNRVETKGQVQESTMATEKEYQGLYDRIAALRDTVTGR